MALLGTPFSKFACKVMLLGAGELGKEVIISLQRLGVEVIAVDRYANAPGHQVAHRSHVINMTDEKLLSDVINFEKPHFIVPEIEAINIGCLERIEKQGLSTIIPSIKAVKLTMDREGIRNLASNDLSIATSPYGFARNLEELQELITDKVGFPCFVKPTMSSSGKGQSKIIKESEIAAAWKYAADAGRVDKGVVIAEGMIDFDYEITLLTVRAKNSKGEIVTHFCEAIGHRQEDGDYVESWQPQAMSDKALKKSKEIAIKITGALGGLGIFGVELFIKGDEVWFSEVSPRPHDTGMVTMISQKQSEFELHAKAILGLPVNTTIHKPGASAVIYGEHDAESIIFEGIDKALDVGDVDIRIFGKPQSYKKRRMGVVLAEATSTEDARFKAKKAQSFIQVKVK